MGSRAGRNRSEVDLWAEIIAEETNYKDQKNIKVFYRRRRSQETLQDSISQNQADSDKENRVSLGAAAAAAPKRVSWNRSLSIRGRVSIAVTACVDNRPQQKQPKRKGKPPVPKRKADQPPNFEKERAYFQEVDAFELPEESPSPKNFGTWITGNQSDNVAIPHLSSRLESWLITKQLKLNESSAPSTALSKLLESPRMPLEPICADDFNTINLITPVKSSLKTNSNLHSMQNIINLITPEESSLKTNSNLHSMQKRINAYLLKKSNSRNSNSVLSRLRDEGCKDIELAVKKLSLASTSTSADNDNVDPFSSLLAYCGQSVPSTLLDVISKYCNPNDIIKVGEGTYGEAYRVGTTVCKIVPIDGELRVNGEVQKRSEELLEEVVLSRTLNHLRGNDGDACNACTTFIETLDLRVCQGPYDNALIRAWDRWDDAHGSENDHPRGFPEKQRYVVFVLQHGGKDLENFVLSNFDEARSLLVQVTSALAVAEAAFEFEHRDLHWGNILLSRNDSATVKFILEGKEMFVRTYGLAISIIDFTLSRINTGENILFLDLSSDPYLFKGPKGDRQAETYRKMKEVTEDCWEGSFPRTNVLWLLYLVDILIQKKSFERSSKNERELRSLKKRLDKYNSAKEAIFDTFFSDLLVDNSVKI
ncbi:Serine/threonine-protein kinase Haspin, putative [Ricinus communis]|uniref:non-specific serine/threonine protein kinase n=1 Tax=Ricinus communis TaxID=3988 RepID=B9RFQ3_RICCO|nr:Serine/threonine-protein kinase Haspin, putative [Ricinus communis]